MKLIVGLGNPGRLYIGSRHNMGFSVVKALAKAYKASFKRDKEVFSLCAKAKIGEDNVILALPLTFMNLSGRAVVALLRKYKIDLDEALVICDDLNLELGRIKLRPSGSSAGQRGLKSIIETLGSNEFGRLRIGIGRPNNMDAASYVLSSFAKRQKEQLKEIIIRACDCCEMWVKEGMSKSMNIFNKRSKNE